VCIDASKHSSCYWVVKLLVDEYADKVWLIKLALAPPLRFLSFVASTVYAAQQRTSIAVANLWNLEPSFSFVHVVILLPCRSWCCWEGATAMWRCYAAGAWRQ
jgi:hypothetical protein